MIWVCCATICRIFPGYERFTRRAAFRPAPLPGRANQTAAAPFWARRPYPITNYSFKMGYSCTEVTGLRPTLAAFSRYSSTLPVV